MTSWEGWATCSKADLYGAIDAPTSFVGRFVAVTAGTWHSCALRTDGTVTCWGENFFGQADGPSSLPVTRWSAPRVLPCGA
ncbi:MAG: RCC1 domain-containing protein [Chloroflexi bacterium]|nr:RCC1 domain-containing protein [Chloroflexota bacterium]